MKKDYAKMLREAGLKVTPSRLTILGVFSMICKPINAEDIYKKLKKFGSDKVTVYRTLSSFEKVGILKRVNLQKDSVYYELADHHHHHIVCTSCGSMEKFELCVIDKISKQILQKSSKFQAVRDHSLELFGMCKSCAKV